MNRHQLFSQSLCLQHTDMDHSGSPRSSRSDSGLFRSLSSTTNLNPLLLRYCVEKQRNGLLLLLEDDKTWTDISRQLSSIPDTFGGTDSVYNPINTELAYWSEQNARNINMNTELIQQELMEANLKFVPSREILFHSNPTLIPMTNFKLEHYKLQNGVNKSAWLLPCYANKTPSPSGKHQLDQTFITDDDGVCYDDDDDEDNLVYCVAESEYTAEQEDDDDADSEELSYDSLDDELQAGGSPYRYAY